MNSADYKYEVAFSFLKQDEHLANQINDLIQNKLNTFLYSKKHEDKTSRNREKTFMDVFGKQSRSVVVLFRNKWGTTPWTKIEEKAIRNRAIEEGYNFLLFIPLDDPPKIPKYLLKAQIWTGLVQWGIKGAATAIEELTQSLVGKLREESQINIAAKIKRDPQFEIERSRFLESVNGFEIAILELKKLFFELKSLKNKIEKSYKDFSIGFQQKDRNCTVNYGGFSIRFYLQQANSNSLMDSYLYFELQKQGISSNEPQILAIEEFHFEVNKPGEYGWIKDVDSDSFISSKKLAVKCMKLLLMQADNKREAKK